MKAIPLPKPTMRHQRLLMSVALVVCAASPVRAQDAERTAVLATVQKLFTGMRTRDTAAIIEAFDSTARMVGVSRDGSRLTLTPPAGFAAGVARAKAAMCGTSASSIPKCELMGASRSSGRITPST